MAGHVDPEQLTRRELQDVFVFRAREYDDATVAAAKAEWQHRQRRDERRGKLRTELAMLDADAVARP